MNYLEYINLVPKYQEGGQAPNPWVELAKDITPGLGTYRAYQRAKEDPRFGTYADVGLSAIGDIATLFGVGAAIKGVSAANKARKAYKAADAANEAYKTYKSAAAVEKGRQAAEIAKIKRGNQTIESLSLMDRSPKVESEIIKRIKNRDAAREGLQNIWTKYEDLWNQARRAENEAWRNTRLGDELSGVVNDATLNAAIGGVGAGLGAAADLQRNTKQMRNDQ